ncbi:unnamed protein product [Prunus armeniaca]
MATKNNGFKQSNLYHTLFLKHQKGKVTTLTIYVDDMIVTRNDKQEISQLQYYLATEFEMKDLGGLKYFLRIKVAQSQQALLHFSLCATKRISSRKIHYSRTNFSATETSSRRFRRAKIVEKDFVRRNFSFVVAQSDFARPICFVAQSDFARRKNWSRKVTLRDEKIFVTQSDFARRKILVAQNFAR